MSKVFIQNSPSCGCGCGKAECQSSGLPMPVMNFGSPASGSPTKASGQPNRDSDWLPTANSFVGPSPLPMDATGLPLPAMDYKG